jgi:hypothetical protein
MKTSLFFGSAVLLLLAACDSAPLHDGALETSSEALGSDTRFTVFAADDAARIACRRSTNRYFCSAEEAWADASECSGPPSGVPNITMESERQTCAKSGELYPTFASCANVRPRHCGYYSACLERALPCGENGYALGFGERYCTAFRSAPLSARGQAWTTAVMGCLERALVPTVAAAGSFATTPASSGVCSVVFDGAFGSHPGCYTSPANSICFLPALDLAVILSTIGAQEILTARTSAQIVRTISICVGQISSEIVRRGFGGAFAQARSAAPSRSAAAEADEAALESDAALESEAALQARRVLFDDLAKRYAPPGGADSEAEPSGRIQ